MDHVISYAKDENKTKIEFNQKYEMLVDDLQNVIDYVELQVKMGVCIKKISKSYDTNFWYFF